MKKMFLFLSVSFLSFIISSCKSSRMATVPGSFPDFYKEGHRGARGLMPENTIPAMVKGLEAGANVLELDVYTTKDGEVLVAHDPSVNLHHSRWADGKEIAKASAHDLVWHQMNYADIRKIDVGSKYYDAFPKQQKVNTHMPLLGELIDSVENFASLHHLPKPIYNIELKTSERYDSLGYNAAPAQMVDAVMKVVKSKAIGNHFYIQSFDVRPLQYIHQRYSKVTIGFLTDSKMSFDENIKELGFYPDIFSPHFSLVTKKLVDLCHANKMKLIPWTVNSKEKMKSLVALGVDGIITDYPDFFADTDLYSH